VSSSADHSAEQLAAVVGQLRVANAGLREVIDAQAAQLEVQAGRIAELERRLGADSTTSNRPPSADSPYRKPAPRSSRRASGRTPGKQPGQPGTTMPLVDTPDEVVVLDSDSCTDCGSDLAGAPVGKVERRQVTDVLPPPPPRVTEYQLITRICRGCAATTCAPAPAVAPARAQYGPAVLARAAELTCTHYLPVGRATALIGSLLGVEVSTGFTAGVRARAARLLEMTFLPRVRELLAAVGVLHADETPGRAEGGLSYVHVACTEYLTAMHTGGRTKTDIDAGGVLPDYAGTIVRDGYAGYAHLIDAHHAWCGAHLLRELRATHAADPDRQFWAAAMADTLTDAHRHAEDARAAGHDRIDAPVLAGILNRYRGATAAGISDNTNRAGPAAHDALRLARRFRTHETMILRFVVDLAVPFTNNQAERDIRPVKIQQRTSGGCWRTLAGLADFAVVRSYLSTTTKWGIETLDAFERLFTTGAWLPPAATPC
jgi:transposase